MLSPALTITNAEKVIQVTINNSVSFKSQNVMAVAYEWKKECWEECDSDCDCIEYDGYWEDGVWQATDCLKEECYEECWEECEEELLFKHFWEYKEEIINIYIQNEIKEIENYKYKYDVSEDKTGRVTAYIVENSKEVCYEEEDENEDGEIYTYTRCYDDKWLDLYLQADGIIYPNSDASYYFAMSELESINNITGLDTSNVTNMSHMFEKASYLKSLHISNFNTSKVTDMSYMFYRTYSNTLNLSSFNTSQVTNMSYMFNNLEHLNTLNVSSFNTSNVVDMRYMFYHTGFNSTKLNTSFTIRKKYQYNSYYEDIFHGIAIQPGTKLIINYTSEASSTIDNIINTSKSVCLDYDEESAECIGYSNGNVVKGAQVD